MAEIFREKNKDSTVVLPMIDAEDHVSYKANPTLAAGDVKVIIHKADGWSVSNITTLPSAITAVNTQVLVSLAAAELNPDDPKYPVIIKFVDQTNPKEWDDDEIIIYVKPILTINIPPEWFWNS